MIFICVVCYIPLPFIHTFKTDGQCSICSRSVDGRIVNCITSFSFCVDSHDTLNTPYDSFTPV